MRIHVIRRWPAASLFLVLLAACGVPREIRNNSRELSLHTQGIQKETERFAKHRDQVAVARTRVANELDAGRLAMQQAETNQLLVWKLNDQDRLKLYQGIVEASETAQRQQEEIAAQRERHAKLIASAKGGVAVRSAQLSKTAQSLARMGKEPDVKSEVAFYSAFFKDVRKQLNDAQQAAGEQAQKATAEAAQQSATPGT